MLKLWISSAAKDGLEAPASAGALLLSALRWNGVSQRVTAGADKTPPLKNKAVSVCLGCAGDVLSAALGLARIVF